MMPRATVIIPTQRRPQYLEVALASITPQAAALDAGVLVVDDGGDAATQAVAARFGVEVLVLEPAEVGVLTGPIVARIEDHAYRTCGREGLPITFLDLGPADADAPHAWGANMTIRRSALERIGP